MRSRATCAKAWPVQHAELPSRKSTVPGRFAALQQYHLSHCRLQCKPLFRSLLRPPPVGRPLRSERVLHELEVRVFGEALDGEAQALHQLEHAGVVGPTSENLPLDGWGLVTSREPPMMRRVSTAPLPATNRSMRTAPWRAPHCSFAASACKDCPALSLDAPAKRVFTKLASVTRSTGPLNKLTRKCGFATFLVPPPGAGGRSPALGALCSPSFNMKSAAAQAGGGRDRGDSLRSCFDQIATWNTCRR